MKVDANAKAHSSPNHDSNLKSSPNHDSNISSSTNRVLLTNAHSSTRYCEGRRDYATWSPCGDTSPTQDQRA